MATAKGLINYICILAHGSGKFDFLGNAKNGVAMVTIVHGINYEYQGNDKSDQYSFYDNYLKQDEKNYIKLLLQTMRCHRGSFTNNICDKTYRYKG